MIFPKEIYTCKSDTLKEHFPESRRNLRQK